MAILMAKVLKRVDCGMKLYSVYVDLVLMKSGMFANKIQILR